MKLHGIYKATVRISDSFEECTSDCLEECELSIPATYRDLHLFFKDPVEHSSYETRRVISNELFGGMMFSRGDDRHPDDWVDGGDPLFHMALADDLTGEVTYYFVCESDLLKFHLLVTLAPVKRVSEKGLP